MSEVNLTVDELAQRLRVSVPTLNRWRGKGEGPKFVKTKQRVLYPLREVEAYEAAHTRQSTREGEA